MKLNKQLIYDIIMFSSGLSLIFFTYFVSNSSIYYGYRFLLVGSALFATIMMLEYVREWLNKNDK